MSLNFFEDGKAIAKAGKKTIYVNDKPVEDGFCDLKLRGDLKFQQIPDKNTERSILYITAPSGSGKSYYTKEYIVEYHKMYPKRDIFIFSSLESDPTLDKLKYIKRMKIKSEAFLTSDLGASDFKDTLCVFDDCDCISDKKIKNKILSIFNQIAETGRHFNVSCIWTSHTATAGIETKKILNECHSITIFPKNAGGKMLKYLLDQYLGLDKEEIKKVKAVEGRWCTILKTYPMTFMSENEMWCRSS
jgi:hypothetical protein